MRVEDAESVRRPEAVFLGDSDGRFEFLWTARLRSQVLAVGLLLVFVPTGFQVVYIIAGVVLPWFWQAVAAAVFGAGSGAAAAVVLTRVYAAYDKPSTRLDYWAEQAWHLMVAPKQPGPPVEHDVVIPDPAGQGPPPGVQWAATAPMSLTDKCVQSRCSNRAPLPCHGPGVAWGHTGATARALGAPGRHSQRRDHHGN